MKILRNILIGLTITILSIFLIAIGITFMFQDKLKQLAINQVNREIKVPILVKGGIDVSLFSHFPEIAVSLKKVSIEDPLRKNEQLIQLDEVALLVSIPELLQEKQKVKKVLFKNGKLFLMEDRFGKTNFDILHKHESKASSSELQLQSVIFKNVDLVWQSIPSQLHFSAKIDNAELKGDFNKDHFGMNLNADFNWKYLIYKLDTISILKPTKLQFSFQIDKRSKVTVIRPSSLVVDKIGIAVEGKLDNSNVLYNEIQLAASCKGDKMATLLSLLPNSLHSKLEGVEGDGEYNLKLNINGKSGSGQSPDIRFNGSLKNGEISLKQLKNPIENVNTTLSYYSQADVFKVEKFRAEYDNKPIDFSFEMNAIKGSPHFTLSANGLLNLHALQSFIPEKYVQNMEGEIEFKNFKLSGEINEYKKIIASSLNGSGDFTFKEAEVIANDVTYGNINGRLHYEHDHLEATDLTANFLTTDFRFNGTIDNLVPYIVEKVKRENTTPLVLDGTLQIKQFNLNNLLSAFKKEEKKQGVEKIDIAEIFNMKGKLDLSVDKFNFNKITIEDITVDLELSPGNLLMKSFDSRAMGGSIHHTGLITFNNRKEMVMNGSLQLSDVEIPKIFEQAENFGQVSLTSKNLKGLIKADINYSLVFENYKNINLNKINATLNCSILKGELINFEPIQAASKFIRLEELNHIYFSDLKNQLIIKNNIIEIPKMEIQSSAINLMMNGSHSFDNMIDYHIKLNLRKLLANKFKRNNTNEYIEEDPYDGTNLFLTLKGKIDNPTIRYDKQYASQKIAEDFRKEKENLKSIFKKETEKTETKEKTKEEKYFDTQEKLKFIDLDEGN